MANKRKLDLTRSVMPFTVDLIAEPGRIREMNPELIRVLKDKKTLSRDTKVRVETLVRTSVRRVMASRKDRSVGSQVLDALRVACSILETAEPRLEARIDALADLVDDHMAERRDVTENSVRRLRHVPQILEYLGEVGSAYRSDLMERFSLQDSNMTRLLNQLESADMIEREKDGKEIKVVLTAAVEDTRPAKTAKPEAAPVFAPSILTDLGKTYQVAVCTDGSIASYALPFAREMGLTHPFNVEITDHDAANLKELYRTHGDVSANRVVVHAQGRSSLAPSGLQNKSMDVYVLGTYVGGGIFASGRSADTPVESAGVAERMDYLQQKLAKQKSVRIRHPRNDYWAAAFSKWVLGGVGGKSMIDNIDFEKPRLTTQNWCKPLSQGELETTHMPLFSRRRESTPNIYMLLSFADIENVHQSLVAKGRASRRAAIAEVTAREHLSALVDAIKQVELADIASHWVLTASLSSSEWYKGIGNTRDVGSRLYWLSALTAKAIKEHPSEFAAYVSQRLNTDLDKGNCRFDFSQETVAANLGSYLRVPYAAEYMKPEEDGKARYHWPSLESEHNEPLATAVDIHLAASGEQHSDMVDRLKKRSRKIGSGSVH
jgi:DNA-binding MarR family transcriptional regulator